MREEMKKIVSTLLWKTKAVIISVDKPFRLASGDMSPIYTDCRVLISYPYARDIITVFASLIYEDEKLDSDYIAGGETAGIPYAAWLADRLHKPFVYVRKKPKGYGRTEQIEGELGKGKTVLLYEDLITDGKSKLNFIEGIRKAGCKVKNCLVIFDRQQGGREHLKKTGVNLYSMTDMETCINVGSEGGFVSSKEIQCVMDYLKDPKGWQNR